MMMVKQHAVVALAIITSTTITNAFTKPHTYPTDLDTSYEWLAADRFKDPNLPSIHWFHPSDVPSKRSFHLLDAEEEYIANQYLQKMPLYPVGCVHVPYSDGNYTLNNIEERNVNMARVSTTILCSFVPFNNAPFKT
jgi:hypothetical protein